MSHVGCVLHDKPDMNLLMKVQDVIEKIEYYHWNYQTDLSRKQMLGLMQLLAKYGYTEECARQHCIVEDDISINVFFKLHNQCFEEHKVLMPGYPLLKMVLLVCREFQYKYDGSLLV